MKLHLGPHPLHPPTGPVSGQLVTLDGEPFYQIAHYDRMRPFFLSIVSGGDHWLFLSSTGALTAGRRHPDLALFPYYTDDKIHDSAEITGSKTILIVRQGGRDQLWEPFSHRHAGLYRVRRHLYKNLPGNRVRFEESNEDLGLTFRYEWSTGERFGFVRQAWLVNTGKKAAQIRLLDGVQNLMPWGVGNHFQLDKSTLLDAYKRNELVSASGLAVFRLSSIPVDRPEPAEALRATTVFGLGLNARLHLLSSVQLDRFRQGESLTAENDVRAERGAYFQEATLSLRPGQTTQWLLVADVARSAPDLVKLEQGLQSPVRLRRAILSDLAANTAELRRLVASADGLQKSARPLGDARHFANVLFNLMRGGVFADGYQLPSADFIAFLGQTNHAVARQHSRRLRQLPPSLAHSELLRLAAAAKDPQLLRLAYEYLPLTFSRRHGDPSRPWNRFNITPRHADGTRVLGYEGNWRDIFQNWEALAVSFPDYLAGMVAKFVNASTPDGYNPYRLTRAGIDWEVTNPHDPWSFIGYWGDHQVIYLLKLLELLAQHAPATLRAFLAQDLFAYANVPYRLKPFAKMLENPKDTVVFDEATQALVTERVGQQGADGRLVWNPSGDVHLVNLTEKLLVLLLAKLSNFIPDAGLWLNTQRPEWNDANNALVGNGCSVVTVCYLRRMLTFLDELLRTTTRNQFPVAVPVADHLDAVHRIFADHLAVLDEGFSDAGRLHFVEALGQAATHYRQHVYRHGGDARRRPVQRPALREFLAVALAVTGATIRTNRRSDGLYHAYNLVRFDAPRTLAVRRLYEMLEGQVAVLSSGLLSAEEALTVLTALRRSAMYRADQHSYVLYPDRALPRFLERNILPPAEVKRSPLLQKLLAEGTGGIVERDVIGRVHFHGDLTNARDLRARLEALPAGYGPLTKGEGTWLCALFEKLFAHESFTGRSGTFFGYEGLGSIYWHMVSKLLLAAQETYLRAVASGTAQPVVQRLAECYRDIRAGLGDCQSPASYGAFPMDPYSHTPGHAGARQPGLTGQVKEDILCRFGELGVSVREGRIHFAPTLLRAEEFLSAPAMFDYYDLRGQPQRLRLPAQALAFTYCQTPIIYRRHPIPGLTVIFADGTRTHHSEPCLDAEASRSLFARTGRIRRLEVNLPISAAVPLPGRKARLPNAESAPD